MSYDEQRISNQIDGGLHKMKEMEKKQTVLMELYDKILPYTTNGKELLAVDVLTLIQEKYLPKEREQMIDLVESLKDYTHENHVILGRDERESSEFVDIYYTQTFKP